MIKLLSTGIATTGLGAIGGSASANPAAENLDDQSEIREVTGHEAQQAIARAVRSREYRKIRRELHQKEDYILTPSEASVIQVSDPNGNPHQIVGFNARPVGYSGSNDAVVGADAAVALRDGEVINARASIVTSDSDADRLAATSQERAGVMIESVSYSLESGSVAVNTDKAHINSRKKPDNNDVVTTASLECDACKVIGNVICKVGCGVGIAAICLAAGIGSGGTGVVVCAPIAGVLCYIFTSGSEEFTGASCNVDVGVEWACYYAGYCSSPT